MGQTCSQAGFETEYEQGGVLMDCRRPGEVVVKRWTLGKDFPTHFTFIDPI